MKTIPYEAIHVQDVKRDPAPGCLVKIYPLEINSSLIKLCDGQFVVGRDESCDLCLSDDSVSRRHACIERLESIHVVTDLWSTNGTYVNEQRVESNQLPSAHSA